MDLFKMIKKRIDNKSNLPKNDNIEFVDFFSSDNNIRIELPKEWKKTDESNYDLYVSYKNEIYLGMYIYNLNEYKGFTENQILYEQFSMLSKRRKLQIVSKNIEKKYSDKKINTVVYLSKSEEYVDSMILMTTITFEGIKDYIVYVIQTCNKDNYGKYQELLMRNLERIYSCIEKISEQKELGNQNANYKLPESGDFNIYFNYTNNVNFDGIEKYFKKYGMNVTVDYTKNNDYVSFAINSVDTNAGINTEIYGYGKKYDDYINEMIEEAKEENEYDESFEYEIKKLREFNSNYLIQIHSKEEVKYLMYMAKYIEEQTSDVMIYDCYNRKYLDVKDINVLIVKILISEIAETMKEKVDIYDEGSYLSYFLNVVNVQKGDIEKNLKNYVLKHDCQEHRNYLKECKLEEIKDWKNDLLDSLKELIHSRYDEIEPINKLRKIVKDNSITVYTLNMMYLEDGVTGCIKYYSTKDNDYIITFVGID